MTGDNKDGQKEPEQRQKVVEEGGKDQGEKEQKEREDPKPTPPKWPDYYWPDGNILHSKFRGSCPICASDLASMYQFGAGQLLPPMLLWQS